MEYAGPSLHTYNTITKLRLRERLRRGGREIVSTRGPGHLLETESLIYDKEATPATPPVAISV